MKHKRYSEGKVQVLRNWPSQALGLALMIFVLVSGKRTDGFNTLRLCSLALTYLLGVALVVHPWLKFDKKHMGRTAIICSVALLAAFVIALLVLSIHGSTFGKPAVVKPAVS
jgi:hypothetical protein